MKNKISVLFLIFAVLSVFVSCNTHKNEPVSPLATPDAAVPTPTPGPDGYYVSTAAGVTFKWKVNGANLDCKLSADTTGWVAVGFNGAAMMQGADLKIGYVTGGTSAFMRDDFGSGHVHSADASSSGTDDITITSGTDNGTTTELIFSLPLNSGDAHDYALAQGASVWLLLSRGPGASDDYVTAHLDRGSVQIVLY